MAKQKYTDFGKCTIWTPTMRADFEGSRLACAIETFRYLDADKMQKALDEMQKIYDNRVSAK